MLELQQSLHLGGFVVSVPVGEWWPALFWARQTKVEYWSQTKQVKTAELKQFNLIIQTYSHFNKTHVVIR